MRNSEDSPGALLPIPPAVAPSVKVKVPDFSGTEILLLQQEVERYKHLLALSLEREAELKDAIDGMTVDISLLELEIRKLSGGESI